MRKQTHLNGIAARWAAGAASNLDRAEPVFVKLDNRRMKERLMSDFDIEKIRHQVRAMEVAMWQDDMADSRANLVIKNMIPTPNEDAFFAMML